MYGVKLNSPLNSYLNSHLYFVMDGVEFPATHLFFNLYPMESMSERVSALLQLYPVARDFRIELYKVYLLTYFRDDVMESKQIKSFRSGESISTAEFKYLVSFQDVSLEATVQQNKGYYMPSTEEVAKDLGLDADTINTWYHEG